jgi:iron complex outermembrane receptor protein
MASAVLAIPYFQLHSAMFLPVILLNSWAGESLNRKICFTCIALFVLFCPRFVRAEEESVLSPVVIDAKHPGMNKAMTVPTTEDAEREIKKTPGGVAVVASEQFENRYSLNFEDTLALTPGVYAQKRFGEEVRIAIRGSGLSRGFHLRGLTLLQDGIPFNLADASADFQEADSLAYQRIEVFKGANGLKYCGSSLGGAINMVTRTGRNILGEQVRLEVGSNATYRTNIQTGRVFDNSDLFLSVTGTTSNGFRQHEDQENVKANANVGVQLSASVETRFYLSANSIQQELPGSVNLRTALESPELADPSSIPQDWARDMRSVRLSNKTTIDFDGEEKLDIGGFLNNKDLYHPITSFVGVIDQENIDYGVFSQISGEYKLAGLKSSYRGGVTTQFGTTDAKLFRNGGGARGSKLTDGEQTSGNVVLFGENTVEIVPSVALVTGGQFIWSKRELEDQLRPEGSDSGHFRSLNPKIGLLGQMTESGQVFANVSRSYEPPTFSELTQGGGAGFTPVNAQEAWTAEVGTRGGDEVFGWDLSLYRAWLQREMLQFTPGGNIPSATFNADRTIHQGVEVGILRRLVSDTFEMGDDVVWRNAYTFSHFFFNSDQQYADNRIPGQPRHFYQTQLRYNSPRGWFTALDLELASAADVDFSNTLKAPGYGVLGINAGYGICDDVDLFFEGRNLLNKGFVSTFSTIVNSSGNTAVFYPGDGRRLFGGIRVSW